MKFLNIALSGLILAATCLSNVANAGLILQVDSATSNMGEYATSWVTDNAIDQSGLSIGYTSGIDDFDDYLALNPTQTTSPNETWFSISGVSSGFFDFSLGGIYNIESFALWNESQNGGQGVNAFNLYADDNINFTTATLLGNFSAIEGLNIAEVFEFSATAASYIRMEVLSNHGSSCCVGIMEVAFEVSTVDVPEPSTLAIFALGMIGLASRRFKKK